MDGLKLEKDIMNIDILEALEHVFQKGRSGGTRRISHGILFLGSFPQFLVLQDDSKIQ